MSTWISKSALIAVVLSGCVAPGSPPQGAAQGTISFASATGEGIVVAGPAGFCALERTKQVRGEAEFVALSACDRALGFLNGASPAILTATIGPENSADGQSLDGAVLAVYLNGREGRRALSSVADSETVTVHEVMAISEAVFVRLTDSSETEAKQNWRALMALKGRLLTLSVRSQPQNELTVEAGQRLIRNFVRAMRRANAT